MTLSLSAPLSILAGCTTDVGDPPAGTVQFEGSPLGAVCAFDDQCATRGCNADPEAGTCGECVTIEALGHDCTGPHQGCSSSAVCKDGVCQSLRKVAGEACSFAAKGGDLLECDDELHCAHIGDVSIGMCLPRIPVGESCAKQSGGCVMGAYCNAHEVCAVHDPSSCGFGWGCDGEYYCGDDDTCHPGTLPENAACGIVDGSFVDNGCEPGLACNGKTCVPLPGKGEMCVHTYACGEGLFCHHSPVSDAQSYCDTLRGEGEACEDKGYVYIRCAAGLECRANTCRVACQ